MPRTNLTRTKLAIFDGVAAANEFRVPGTAGDVSNNMAFDWTGREQIILTVSGVTARTVTIPSVPVAGRSGDITTYSVAAGEVHIIPPFVSKGWVQADGKVYLDPSHAELVVRVVQIPDQLPL
jgi:hypothetical protein